MARVVEHGTLTGLPLWHPNVCLKGSLNLTDRCGSQIPVEICYYAIEVTLLHVLYLWILSRCRKMSQE